MVRPPSASNYNFVPGTFGQPYYQQPFAPQPTHVSFTIS